MREGRLGRGGGDATALGWCTGGAWGGGGVDATAGGAWGRGRGGCNSIVWCVGGVDGRPGVMECLLGSGGLGGRWGAGCRVGGRVQGGV